MSWGVDGSLCLWDSYSQGNINSPIAVLRNQDDYPVYAVATATVKKKTSVDIAIAVGGGSDGGFIGIPLFLYDVQSAGMPAAKESKPSETKECKQSS